MKLFSFLTLLTQILSSGCATSSTASISRQEFSPCPQSPNCVVSTTPDDQKHFISPLAVKGVKIDDIVKVLKEMKLKIEIKEDNFIHATATSAVFGFIDDVLIEIKGEWIHFRSSSRSGYYDFGVNRKRVEKIKEQLFKTNQ